MMVLWTGQQATGKDRSLDCKVMWQARGEKPGLNEHGEGRCLSRDMMQLHSA